MMGDVARGGRTVLFVSHNLTALRNLCTTGLLLNEGRIEARGHIDDVLNRYASARATEGDMAVELPPAPADQVASLRRLAVLAQGANADGPISVRTPFDITVELDVRRPDVDIGVYLHCHDGSQNRVFSTGSFFNPALNGVALDSGRYRFACEIPADLLNEGEYTLDVMLVRDRSEVLATESSILSFRVHGAPTGIEGWNWPILGVIRPQLQWSCARSPIASPSGATAETI
jgi:lipopolysaccharide transport system ATP-binding protein